MDVKFRRKFPSTRRRLSIKNDGCVSCMEKNMINCKLCFSHAAFTLNDSSNTKEIKPEETRTVYIVVCFNVEISEKQRDCLASYGNY